MCASAAPCIVRGKNARSRGREINFRICRRCAVDGKFSDSLFVGVYVAWTGMAKETIARGGDSGSE